MLRCFWILLLLPWTALAGQGPAVAPPRDPAALCESAVAAAEVAARLPPRLLDAISVTESGRPDPVSGERRAWPWTINAEGEGTFLATRQDAVAAVRALQARGVQSIDVGCMQVNLMYHPRAFASLEEAFDPRANAAYAARFLNALFAEHKDWAQAIAAYHSETPALGDAYRVLVLARWRGPATLFAAPAPGSPYGDFAKPSNTAYGAFAPASSVHGAFAPPACPAGRCGVR
jgi:hypothetical protein